ncbi:MAG: hypothetical protein ACFFCS_20820, partial [Candidatus Hodarchaeota archaeon]
MIGNKLNTKFMAFTKLGTMLYLALLVPAFLLYPGGSNTNPDAVGFSIWENYTSDAGRFISISGENNTRSLIFFIIAYVLYGICSILLSLGLSTRFEKTKRNHRILKIGT